MSKLSMALGRAGVGVLAALALSSCLTGTTPPKDYALIKDGKAVSRIVLDANAGVVERHAASELAAYLGKITGAKVETTTAPSDKEYNIYLGTLDTKSIPLSPEMKAGAGKVDEEGYMLAADADGLRIVGQKPIGCLYGVYALLKKRGDVRWFAPGDEFERCPKKPSFTVEQGVAASNPSFSGRSVCLVCANWNSRITDTWDWLVRNGMRLETAKHAQKILHPEEREKRGTIYSGGGHSFAYLISDKLFAEHPEYFPLMNGKRVTQEVPGLGDRNQPCTSNPKVVEIMTDKLMEWGEIPPRGGRFLIGNNDSPGWCQCGECAKLDPPEEREKNIVSTRYWTLLNAMAKKALAENPELRLQGWGYQNFREPPVGIVPDKRLSVAICVHQRCYRHRMDDESCPSNQRFRELLEKWGKLNPISAREYTNCMPAGDILYLPMERVYANDLKYYHKIGVRGAETEMPPPDGEFGKVWDNRKTKEMWQANWQLMYMMAYFLWDVDADYDAVYEDMGSKFYGATWPAMRQYREKLTKAYEETPGCMIYGTPDIALGKCLERPGLEAELLKLLDDAERAAAGDAALLKTVRREREYFALSWQKVNKEYVAKSKLEVGATKRTDKLAVDGKLDEADWKKADFITGFVSNKGEMKDKADPQTFVRILYDKDNVYFGVEAMEPEPGKTKAVCGKKDGPLWSDNAIELFVAAPNGNGKYLHLIVNSNGVAYDSMATGTGAADTAFDSGAEYKTSVLPDKWILEARVPASAFGSTIKDGEVWKVNVARDRVLTDGTSQGSSLCDGAYHGAEAFRSVAFGGKGLLQNGDFEDVVKPSEWTAKTKWAFETDAAPAQWGFHDYAGTAELRDGGAASGKRFLRVRSKTDKSAAVICQQLNIDEADTLLVRAKVRGKGTVGAYMFLYDKKPVPGGLKHLGSPSFGETLKVDSKDWTVFEASYKHDGKTIPYLALFISSAEGIDIDDVTILRGKNMDGLAAQ